jgi:hypothetical protein
VTRQRHPFSPFMRASSDATCCIVLPLEGMTNLMLRCDSASIRLWSISDPARTDLVFQLWRGQPMLADDPDRGCCLESME